MTNHIGALDLAAALTLFIILALIGHGGAAKRQDYCEVCHKVFNGFLDIPAADRTPTEQSFMDMCKDMTGKEWDVCYAIGGNTISATSIMSKVVRWIDNYIPAEKICQKIMKEGHVTNICDYKYDKPIDISEPEKLYVKELKKVLTELKVDMRGFVEKSDFVRAVQQNAHRYPKQEL